MQEFIDPAQDVVDHCNALLAADANMGPLNTEQLEFTETILRNTERFITQTHSFAEYIAQMQAGVGYFPIAHDWRTPLAAMVGYSDLLAEGMVGTVNDVQQAAYQQIHKHSITLRDEVQALVDFAKQSSEQVG